MTPDQEILNNVDKALEKSDSSYCMAHSGVREVLKALARDQEAQWKAINAVSNRLWGILILTAATLATVLFQVLTNAK